MASLLSQRQTVAPLIEATIPLLTAVRAISALLRRESGMPLSLGISQANALISIMTLGGENGKDDLAGGDPEARQDAFQKSASSICSQSGEASLSVLRFLYYQGLRRQARLLWREQLHSTVTYIFAPVFLALFFLWSLKVLYKGFFLEYRTSLCFGSTLSPLNYNCQQKYVIVFINFCT
jgi:hypothetical protein